MRYDISPDKIEEQIKREEAQREGALGRRFGAAQAGFLGPVISRWINSSIAPVAQRIRLAAEAYGKGDYAAFGNILDTPTFGLASAYDAGSPEYLEPILKWCLKGSSPGRLGEKVTYCEDLVLATLGRTISDLAMRSLSNHGRNQIDTVPGLSLAMVLSSSAASARETALGQFITMVQGAEALAKVRRRDRSSWAQRKSLGRISGMLASQVRHTLESEAKGEINLEHVGARTIVKVLDLKNPGVSRRVSIKADDLEGDDWRLLQLATFPKGEADPAKNAWITFAMMVLCAAQVEHGWFDLTHAKTPKQQRSRKRRAPTRYLILAEQPRHHLKADLAKWISMGFSFEPMLIPPTDGSYLTVKTRAITGRNGPHGWRTEAAESSAWATTCAVMGCTPWKVAKGTLDEIMAGTALTEVVQGQVPDELTRRLILSAHQRDSFHEEVYLPLYMDFRGRIYPRTSWVSYQGGDLQKGLLQFTPSMYQDHASEQAVALHVTSLMGHDKVALPERLRMYRALDVRKDGNSMIGSVEEPVQLWTALNLLAKGRPDDIPLQIDGTCNGLQHLSAMFRDHEAAPWVNIAPSSLDTPPNDLYRETSGNAAAVVALRAASGEAWAMRIVSSGATINRSVCKRPVMVLPYGGTMVAIEEGVTEGILGQNPDAKLWQQCLKTNGELDPKAIANGYLAFQQRPLTEHPLFRSDMRELAKVVYDAIKLVIPKAMEAMDAFRKIAGCVGDRSLEWSNGVEPAPMWIVHAYPKSERRTNIFRGFHLPNSVRGLAMRSGRDEIDPAMHRTGIVANFIHSQDAAHLAVTMDTFRAAGGTTFGANHDCLYGRASEMATLGTSVREAFALRYSQDPLGSPVRLRSHGGNGKVETFESWYGLAKAFGVEFPGMGRWDPQEVLRSPWFFS